MFKKSGLYICFFFTLYYFLPWEWSFVDDLGLVTQLRTYTHDYGLWNGIFTQLSRYTSWDRIWGLFRPAYWLYSSVIYLFSPNLVYTLRALMVATILFLPAFQIFSTHRLQKKYFLILIFSFFIANHPVFDGLSFSSQQETSGNFFIALGFYFYLQKRNPIAYSLSFLIAALFKAPFIWLSILLHFYKVFFDKKDKNKYSELFLLLSLLTLGTTAYWAFNGGYTSKVRHFSPSDLLLTFMGFFKYGLPLIFLATLNRVFFRFKINATSIVLILSGVLYFLNLIPWGSSSGYLFSPPLYLISLGYLHSLIPQEFGFTKLKTIALTFSILIGIFVSSHAIWKLAARNITIRGVRDWALQQNSNGIYYATNGDESAHRFKELLQLRSNLKWDNKVEFTPLSSEQYKLADYYILFLDQGTFGEEKLSNLILRLPLARVYKIH